MLAPIRLKFETHIGDSKANARLNFGVNMANIQRVISDCTHKVKLKFFHAYMVNHFKEQVENLFIA